MMAITLVLDAVVYLRAAYLRKAKPPILVTACLGSLPIMVVGGLSFLMESAVTQTISLDLPNVQARVNEEILAHTYLGLVSAVFLPFLVIRLLQQFKATK
jgi:TRAP-type C4-dicarboxylate transport system permease small subunit